MTSDHSAPPGPDETLKHMASAMRKLLPPALFAEVLAHLDPLTSFVKFLREHDSAALSCATGEERPLEDKTLQRVRDYVHWHNTTPNSSFSEGSPSRIAFDAQTRTLGNLLFWIENGDDYLDACIKWSKEHHVAGHARPEDRE